MSNSTAPRAWRFLADLPRTLIPSTLLGRRCPVCGYRTPPGGTWELAPELVEGWRLDPRWQRMFERREGLTCRECGSVIRYQLLATVIMDELGAWDSGCKTFSELTDSRHFKQLSVAEINGCGPLHDYMSRNPTLAYSEYGSRDPAVPSEDLLDLSYRDGQFDLVVTSDTLEHVPDLGGALAEIERVLKPGGRHIFTVPVVWDGRKTRRRAVLENGRVVHLLPPSYHGVWAEQNPDRLVFHEFGEDVLDYVRTSATEVTVRRDTANPSLTVFVAVKKTDTDVVDGEERSAPG